MKNENSINLLDNGVVVAIGKEAVATWNKTKSPLEGEEGNLSADSRLTDEENVIICGLAFFPEDEDVKTKLNILSKDKPLAVAIYDAYNGAIMFNQTDKAQMFRKIFIKLFSKEPSKLF